LHADLSLSGLPSAPKVTTLTVAGDAIICLLEHVSWDTFGSMSRTCGGGCDIVIELEVDVGIIGKVVVQDLAYKGC
jgi:hypothetical protein